MLRHKPDQPFAAPGDNQVHQIVLLQQFQGGFPGHAGDDLHRGLGNSGLGQGVLHELGQGQVGVKGLLAALEDHGVPTFQTKGGGIHRDIGTGLINKADHPQGNALSPHFQAVGPHATCR